ncbi:MAG: helix-hairpin-helix domain-containing protein [Mucilaginibacter polytrichastri]|nr:helix-hairpin-helix domain-containing protein [Mucilaginibacter polytrichastri]
MNISPDRFFGFNRRELNGILILSLLIFGVIIAPYLFPLFQTEEPVDFTEIERQIALLRTRDAILPGEKGNAEKKTLKTASPRLFSFDPNNLPAEKWAELGLSERQIRGIKNYEAKGGRFRTKADLQKMYTISDREYQQLEPFIRIPVPEKHAAAVSQAVPFSPPKIREDILVALNSADSATLTQVRGIGPAFASRIIRYRERLGGFVQKEQLREVYGLDSANYLRMIGQLQVNAGEVRRIAINTVDLEELRRFPYLRYKQANAIIQYRNQHGPYRSIDDLKPVVVLDAEILRKIEPYLRFQ